MNINGTHHPALLNRVTGSDVPIECDCGEHFAWARWRGKTVQCPTCKKLEILDIPEPPQR